jgi:acyl dehydratase
MLGKAAIPCALFSMGASLAVYRITGALAESTATVTRPVEVGQTLRCEGTVIELHPRAPGQSFVVVGLTAFNTQGATVAVGQAQVTVPD